VHAAPEEITVFTDDIQAPRTFGLTLHGSHVPARYRAARDPDARGATPGTRLMPEVAFGLGSGWETALHVPVSHSSGSTLRSDGAKLRLKYVPESAGPRTWFWGGNVEIARFARHLDEHRHKLELKLIGGWRGGPWLVAGNINTHRGLTGDDDKAWSLSPSAKVTYALRDTLAIGVERYHDMGHVRNAATGARLNFVVADFSIAGFAVNAGIGRGEGERTDRWAFKAVVAVPW